MLETLIAIVLWAGMVAGTAGLATLAVNGAPADIARLKTYSNIAGGIFLIAVVYGVAEWVRDHPANTVTGFTTALLMCGLVYACYGQMWRAREEDAAFVPFDVPDTERDPAHRAD